MKTIPKILITIVSIVTYIALCAVNFALRQESGHITPGMLPVILTFVLIAVLRAIWKKKKTGSQSVDQEEKEKEK